MSRPAFLKTQINLYFLISVLLAVIPAVLILCIPLVSLEGSGFQKAGAYIISAVFWLCVILELWMVRMCNSERLWLERRKVRSRMLAQAGPGVISFIKTREGLIADVIMFVSLIAVIVIAWIQVRSQWVILSCVSVLYLSFNMHCLLNGKNYRYIKLLSNYKKEHERDEQNKS